MTQEKIIKGINLIAVYMGYTVKSISDTSSYRNERIMYFLYSKNGITTSQVLYDSSWDWLMPVVKKISNFNSSKLPKESAGWYAYHSFESNLFEVDINMVFENAVKFIEWYNTQKL